MSDNAAELDAVPDYLQDQEWLMCQACAHLVFHVPADGPRPTGRPRPGDRCPVCVAHGPNHRGRLILIRAHLTQIGGEDFVWDREETALLGDAYGAGVDVGMRSRSITNGGTHA